MTEPTGTLVPHAQQPPNGLATVPAIAPSVVDVTTAGLERLRQWVAAAQHAHQLVAPLVSTPFVPDSYRPKVDPRATDEEKREAYNVAVATATAAVLQGISVGLDPLTSLQQIYIIHGRPGMYAKMMVALTQAAGHEVWTEENTGTRAVVAGRRKGTTRIERVTITMDMARAANWTRNENYAKVPADMLWARAASRVCDRIASDVLRGVAAVEQIQDEYGEPGRQRTVSRARKAVEPPPPSEQPALPAESAPTPQRGSVAANPKAQQRMTESLSAAADDADLAWAGHGPPLPGEDAPALPDPEPGQPASEAPTAAEPAHDPAPTAGVMASTAQLKMIGALIGKLGVNDRVERLRIAGTLAEIDDMQSMTELTKRAASQLIERLTELEAKPEDARRAAVAYMTADPTLPMDGDQ